MFSICLHCLTPKEKICMQTEILCRTILTAWYYSAQHVWTGGKYDPLCLSTTGLFYTQCSIVQFNNLISILNKILFGNVRVMTVVLSLSTWSIKQKGECTDLGIDQNRTNIWHEQSIDEILCWQSETWMDDSTIHMWPPKPNSHVSFIIVEPRNHIWSSYMYLFPYRGSLNVTPLSNNWQNTSLHCMLFFIQTRNPVY